MSFISLIRPATIISRWAYTAPTCPPLGPAYLASSLIQSGHQVQIVDAVGEAPFQTLPLRGHLLIHGLTAQEAVDRVDPGADVLGVSCMCSHEWPYALEHLRLLRSRFRSKPILVGGEHCTSMAEWILKSCPEVDYCVLGEGEEKLVRLVEALSRGKDPEELEGVRGRRAPCASVGKFQPLNSRIFDVDSIPEPAWELCPIKAYLDNGFGFGVNRGRCIPMLATRGCPHECAFCSSPGMWGRKWIARNPSRVIDEMERYVANYGVENIDFYDLTAILRREWIVEFCGLIQKRRLRLTWQLPSGTRSEAIDKEVAGLLYESGCRNISYAPESGSAGVLNRARKRVDLHWMKESMRHAVKRGLNVKCHIIIGFPHETHREIRSTLLFLISLAILGVHDVTMTPCTMYPGSEIFRRFMDARGETEFTDEFFLSLTTFSDMAHTLSQSEHISHRALHFYRLLGLALFYGLSYALRPWRMVTTAMNLVTGRQESRMDMFLQNSLQRLFNMRGRRSD